MRLLASSIFGWAILTILGVTPRAHANLITVPTGAEFVGNFPACINAFSFVCPAKGVSVEIDTTVQNYKTLGYSIEAFLISDADGQVIPIGSNDFLFRVLTSGSTGEPQGNFTYLTGVSDSFPFPSSGNFWGSNPSGATFSVLYRNTGLPFTFLSSPEESVWVNLDSAGEHWAVTTISVTFVAPEAATWSLLTFGIAALAAFARRRSTAPIICEGGAEHPTRTPARH